MVHGWVLNEFINLMFGIDGECQITCAVGLFWQTLRLFAQQIFTGRRTAAWNDLIDD